MTEIPVLINEVVLDGVGQVELIDPALLQAVFVDPLADDSTAKVHERKGFS